MKTTVTATTPGTRDAVGRGGVAAGGGAGGEGAGPPGLETARLLGAEVSCRRMPLHAMHAFMCPLDFTGLLAPVNYNAVLELKFRDFMKLQREFLIIMAKKY